MTAALPMGANKITGMADPTVSTDAATKNYVDTSILAGVSVPLPQGYLTPSSNTPIITSDVISSTNVFYTFKDGPWLPIHNGTSIIPFQMTSQFQLALTSSQAANNIYDIFLAYNTNSPVIGTGPSWAAGTGGSVTAGSCARGTGVGGTALTRLNGFNVNAAAISLIWNTGSGNTTISVPANQGIYLGSIFIDSVAGQVTCHRSYGQSRKWGVWNAYNRAPLYLKAGDSTASWTYALATVRAANGNSANSLTTFCGLAEEIFDLRAFENMSWGSSGISGTWRIITGIGLDSTTTMTGATPNQGFSNNTSVNNQGTFAPYASYFRPPILGTSVVTLLEASTTSGTVTISGGEANNHVSAWWRG